MEDSTGYWDAYGDLDGRLMIDLHNRLISPVIKRYRGRIVKHIGDSIMASFKSPRNALKAAIGIQQILEKRRKEDIGFSVRVRIGVHTGKALVEDSDIFGDAVNLAARVQSLAKGNEICVSNDTASMLNKETFALVNAGSFRIKGKASEITLYKCQWRNYQSLIAGVKQNAWNLWPCSPLNSNSFWTRVLLFPVSLELWLLLGCFWPSGLEPSLT
jgi:adenylate cyclase